MSLKKQIAINKLQAGTTGAYVSLVDDDKIQEIAALLACNVKIITSGSDWLLYRGDDDTAGFELIYSSNRLTIYPYYNETKLSSSSSTTIACIIAGSNTGLKYFWFNKSPEGNVRIGLTGSSNCYYIAKSKIKTQVIYVIRPNDPQSTIYSPSNFNVSQQRSVYYRDDSFVMFTAIPLPNGDIIDGLYWSLVQKNTTDVYMFTLDGKTYSMSKSYAEDIQKVVMELVDIE